MRRLALLVVLLLLAALVVRLVAFRAEDAPTASSHVLTNADVASDDTTERARMEFERATSNAASTQHPADTTRVLGSAVDESGAPLAAARAWVFALDGRWRDGVLPPELSVRGGKVRAFVATTDADGRFAITAPTPTGRRLRLELETQDHRGHLARDLGKKTPSTEPALVAGENDLGTLVVPLRGAILGVVRAKGGGALEGASVVLEDIEQKQVEASCASASDGSFVLSCVRAGSFRLVGELEGYERADREDIVIARSETLAGIDLTLARTPAISGLVVDETGAPVSGLVVRALESGTPSSSEPSAVTWTGVDGSFRVKLRSEASHTLRLVDPRFVPWDSRSLGLPPFLPGAEGVRIVLSRLPICSLSVLDEHTRTRLFEYAAYQVVQGESLDAVLLAGALEYRALGGPNRSNGVLTFPLANPPPTIAIKAPGYSTRIATLTTELEQVLGVVPQGGLRGRLQSNGKPATGARVWIRPAATPDGFEPGQSNEIDFLEQLNRSQLDPGADGSSPRVVRCAEDGSFLAGTLDAGEWTVLGRLEDKEGPVRRLVDVVRVEPGIVQELGVLELGSGRGTARIHFVCDDDLPLSVLQRDLVAGVNGARIQLFSTPPIERNTYRVEGATPGTLVVRLGPPVQRFGSAAKSVDSLRDRTTGNVRSFSVELREGQEVPLEVDLTELELCHLVVRIEAGTSRSRLLVRVQLEHPTGIESLDALWWRRGRTSEVSTIVPGSTRVFVEACEVDELHDEGLVLARSEILALPRRGRFETTLVVP